MRGIDARVNGARSRPPAASDPAREPREGWSKLTSWTNLRESAAGVTFVTFPRGIESDRPAAGVTFGRKLVTFVRHRRVPGAGEVGVPRPIAQAIGALPAHPRRSRRARDAAGLVQGDDELDLPVGGPAVLPDAARGRGGRGMGRSGVGVLHPPAWSR